MRGRRAGKCMTILGVIDGRPGSHPGQARKAGHSCLNPRHGPNRAPLRTITMVAPVASPTLIHRSPVFPRLLPLPPRPHPIPPAPSFQRRERFINYRDIWREMEELSGEEDAVEDQVCTVYLCLKPVLSLNFLRTLDHFA